MKGLQEIRNLLAGRNDGSALTAPSIIWPEPFLPGFADNFVSNEVVTANLAAEDIWPHLEDPFQWPEYYPNTGNIYFYNGYGPVLEFGARFRFKTFSFTIEAEVVEFQAPSGTIPGRIAWHGWTEGDAGNRLDVHHAFLLENLSRNRVRILTQEAQIGRPARKMAAQRPNPMLNAHQDWLAGLIEHTRKSSPD